ncbi:MBL fold metallo-hydrolase [Paenibacillus sp. P96]|uniref:MBL fold metallo-hydrolase n=1 Tax=Paenibacillus zeirhizosphaerae TaxID=2987519 RepID=A0ABT9FLU7_9BACL|nr:MBL fold metallo-hydrolase [Paenibacillus sp. P96]MDP4095702.1 MBL fold metallo-hydrolase [Paenibacillus sp. P96]
MKLPEWTRFDEEGIIQVKITMAFPLRWVNSYIVPEDEGITVVDPGPHTPAAVENWEQVLAELNWTVKDISRILITHHHPDHYGLAGWLQERSGAPVLMSTRSMQEASYMWGTEGGTDERLIRFFSQHGLPRELSQPMHEHLQGAYREVLPQPEVTCIEEGDKLVMGGRAWDLIMTGGHAPGHLSLYQPESGTMMCGDAVLPQISPNVSLLPGSDPQPFAAYMAGLRKLGQYEVRQAFPGHRHPFLHFKDRTVQLLDHHEARLEQLASLLGEEPRNAYHLCLAMFGDKLTVHQLRFALSETLAHLVELTARGQAEEREDSGGTVYVRR